MDLANVRPSSDYIAHLDGYTVIPGGWLNSHYIQLGYQLADSVSGGAYSFFGTCLILGALDFLGKFVPVLKLRVSDEEEILGLDDVEIGEFAVSLVFYLSVSIPPFFSPGLLADTRPFSTTTSNSRAKSASRMKSTRGCRRTRWSNMLRLWAWDMRRIRSLWIRRGSWRSGRMGGR